MDMPDERDITKQQLWSRIDTVLETIGTVGRNTMDNVQAVLPKLQRDNELALAEFKNQLKTTIADMQDFINNKIKFIESLNNTGFSQMVNEGQRLRKDIDTRLQTIHDNISQEMSEKMTQQFNAISDGIHTYTETVNEYKKLNDTQLASLQRDIDTKLGEIKGLFDDMKKKFKKITEQLQ